MTSAGNCAAAGSYTDSSNNEQAVTATETNGTWAQAAVVAAPGNAHTSPTTAIFGGTSAGVSCWSAGNRTAAGGYIDSADHWQNMTAIETNGTWAQSTEVSNPGDAAADPNAGFNGVSCASAGNCTAVVAYNDSAGDVQASAATQDSGPSVAADRSNVSAPENATATNTGTFADYEPVTLTASTGTITQDNIAGTWAWSGLVTAAPYSVTVTATNADDNMATTIFTVNTNLAITTHALVPAGTVGTVGTAHSQPLMATGGTPPCLVEHHDGWPDGPASRRHPQRRHPVGDADDAGHLHLQHRRL